MIIFKYLVTSALPYGSNIPHLGNIVGSVLPADVYSRFLKIGGKKCRYVCGTDANGTPIEVEANKHGEEPSEWVEKKHREIKDLFDELNLDFDVYSSTTEQIHADKTIEIYEKLKENGYIYKKDIEILYCPECENSLPDRYVRGECPKCGAEGAKGDQCDECGSLFDKPNELVDYYCSTCKSKPEERKSEHVFFKLSALEDEIKELLDEKKDKWPNTTVKITENLLKEGLRDKDISRDMDWGIEIPDQPGQVFYVWIDAPIGYISFSKEIGIEDWWKDEDTKLIQFMGKDNVPFHSVYFPATLKGTRDGYIEPEVIKACEFLNYGGGQFSKSKNTGVYLDDALDIYPADYWRYALIKMYPGKRDREFSWEEFRKIINHDLNDVVGNFVHRTLTFTEKFFESKVPEPDLKERDKKMLEAIDETEEKLRDTLHQKMEFNRAIDAVVNLARKTNKYITDEEPWKNKERQKEVTYTSLQVTKALSIYLEPFIPETADKIKKYLGINPSKIKEAKEELEPGHEIQGYEPLFEKISEKEAEKYREKFKGKENKEVEEMNKIPFDQFKKLDIKTGRIKKAEEIEKSDNLYKITIDIGEEERTAVAGLREYYELEELKDKDVVVVTNLEPAEIMGVKSEAMVLAAVEGDEVSLLKTDKEMNPGVSVE
ncbi:MAG: methionine--tRNA ligase [archaeon]